MLSPVFKLNSMLPLSVNVFSTGGVGFGVGTGVGVGVGVGITFTSSGTLEFGLANGCTAYLQKLVKSLYLIHINPLSPQLVPQLLSTLNAPPAIASSYPTTHIAWLPCFHSPTFSFSSTVQIAELIF